jgi:predicted carbohydrate-binding protein with CBM5 and CBM33 domain
VSTGGTQPLYDWFGVLRSDGAGRTSGFIPDGSLCGGGTTKFAAYDAPGTAWPVTHLTGGAPWTFRYNAWAAHPGQFRLYVTKDGYDPSKPLAWSDLESSPFSTWSETSVNGQGEYYWNTTLPQKSGRHVIYTVWARTDSQETFYSCSDVVFDGGSGKVTGIPGYDGDTGTATTAPVTTTTRPPVTTTTTRPPVTTTTTTRPPVTTTRPPVTTTVLPSATMTSTGPKNGSGSCTASVAVTSTWSGGYQGSVTVLNKGSAISPWTLTFTVPSGVTIQSGWNGDFSSSGSTVTVKAPSWAQSLASNAQVNVGFVANGPASPPPSAVKLQGVACA